MSAKRRLLRVFRYIFWPMTGFDPARWQWYRQAYKGHWERWWVDAPVAAYIWFEDCQPCSHRTGLARGVPECDDRT